jgi:hypothetical protein
MAGSWFELKSKIFHFLNRSTKSLEYSKKDQVDCSQNDSQQWLEYLFTVYQTVGIEAFRETLGNIPDRLGIFLEGLIASIGKNDIPIGQH